MKIGFMHWQSFQKHVEEVEFKELCLRFDSVAESSTRPVMIPIFLLGSSCATEVAGNSVVFSKESSWPEHIRANLTLEGRVLMRDLGGLQVGLDSSPEALTPSPSPMRWARVASDS